MLHRRLFSIALAASCAVAACRQTHAAVTLTRFGLLGAGDESYFRAISDDGSVAYGDSLITGDPATQGTIYRMAKWTPAAGQQDLGNGIPTTPAPGYYYSTVPNATSADGRVVVGHDGGTLVGRRAFRWSAATGFEYLGNGGPFEYRARAVSPDGLTTLVEADPRTVLAWTGNTVTTIPNMQQATGVSTGGAVIAGNATTSQFGSSYVGASRWTLVTGTTLLPTLGGNATAGPVTPDGTIAGIAITTSGNAHLVLWPATGGIVDLGATTPSPGSVTAITPDARTLVGTFLNIPSRRTEAFIWNQTSGLTRVSDLLAANGIDLGNFYVTSLDDVTADGQTFVGYLQGPNGATEGILLTLPEPAAAALLLPLAGLLLPRRRPRLLE